MAVVKKEYVRPYRQVLYCDKCNVKMEKSNDLDSDVFGDHIYFSFPPKFTYICPQCNNTELSVVDTRVVFYEMVEE